MPYIISFCWIPDAMKVKGYCSSFVQTQREGECPLNIKLDTKKLNTAQAAKDALDMLIVEAQKHAEYDDSMYMKDETACMESEFMHAKDWPGPGTFWHLKSDGPKQDGTIYEVISRAKGLIEWIVLYRKRYEVSVYAAGDKEFKERFERVSM